MMSELEPGFNKKDSGDPRREDPSGRPVPTRSFPPKVPTRRWNPLIAGGCVAVLLAADLACGPLWSGLRERERRFAWSRALDSLEHGRCREALADIERAQAAATLSRSFAASSTLAKARCLERTSRPEEALAHYRFLRDFFADSVSAQQLPEDLRQEDAAAPEPAAGPEVPATFAGGRYSESARRSGIGGEVDVSYLVDLTGSAQQIRVVHETHPLLASWAIEAAARARFEVSGLGRESLPFQRTTRFRFERQGDLAD